ncbi:MFS transporter [Streptomyces sp. NPDC055681]
MIVLALRLGMPESLRWLMSKGRTEEARRVAAESMDEDEQQDLAEQVADSGRSKGLGALFSRDCRKATIFCSVFWVCNVTPYFAIANAVSTALSGVYPGEVFSTEIRGAGVGFDTAASRIGAAAGTFLLPLAMSEYGVAAAMPCAAGVSLIGRVVSHFLAPETKGLPLSVASASTEDGPLQGVGAGPVNR